MDLSSFNSCHPELWPGEIFISNVQNDTGLASLAKRYTHVYDIRFGTVAYANNGSRLTGFVPVFGKLKPQS